MKLFIFSICLSFFSSSLFAETTTYEVEGPHCKGCANTIEKKICGDQSIKDNTSECKAEFNKKTKTAFVTITSKKDSKINTEDVEKKILAVDENYKILKPETK